MCSDSWRNIYTVWPTVGKIVLSRVIYWDHAYPSLSSRFSVGKQILRNQISSISLIHQIIKVLQRLVRLKAADVLDRHKLLKSNQHGFLHLHHISNVFKVLRLGFHSESFDSAEYYTLLSNSSNVGISGKQLHLFGFFSGERNNICNR